MKRQLEAASRELAGCNEELECYRANVRASEEALKTCKEEKEALKIEKSDLEAQEEILKKHSLY
jgi:hypothetical protein